MRTGVRRNAHEFFRVGGLLDRCENTNRAARPAPACCRTKRATDFLRRSRVKVTWPIRRWNAAVSHGDRRQHLRSAAVGFGPLP